MDGRDGKDPHVNDLQAITSARQLYDYRVDHVRFKILCTKSTTPLPYNWLNYVERQSLADMRHP